LPAQPLPADTLEQFRDPAGLGDDRPLIEIPRITQHARRQVECALAQLPERSAVIEQPRGLVVHAKRPAAARVDRVHEAVFAVAAELAVDALRFGAGVLADAKREARVI